MAWTWRQWWLSVRRSARAWHKGNPLYSFLLSLFSSPSTPWSPLAVARTLLVSKMKGCLAEPRGVGRAPRPPHRCPSSLGRARQGQPAALPCPTQGPRHTGLLGKTLDFKQATAPVFARHRFPSSFLPTFSLADREVFQALAYEGRGLRKASWNLRRLPSPGKPSGGPGSCASAVQPAPPKTTRAHTPPRPDQSLG